MPWISFSNDSQLQSIFPIRAFSLPYAHDVFIIVLGSPLYGGEIIVDDCTIRMNRVHRHTHNPRRERNMQ